MADNDTKILTATDFFANFDTDLLEEQGLIPAVHQRDAVLIIYSHCLPSHIPMVRYLCKSIGFDPGNIYFIAKDLLQEGAD